MNARNILMTVLASTALSAQALAAGPGEWLSAAPAVEAVPVTPAPAAVAPTRAKIASYIVQGPSFVVAAGAVRAVGGRITHELPIINAVAATLTARQHDTLRSDHRLTLTDNGSAKVAGSSGTVQPYVVEQTQANLLHASGITGKGVTIAFLDTGWWSQKATQQDTGGHNVVLQGYDAIGNTVGVGAPDDQFGHGTHVLSIATNSALSQDGTYVGMAPDANRVIVRAFDSKGVGSYANVIRGMNWILANKAAYNIRVVNMSFGAAPQSFYWNDPMALAVMKLWQAGIVVVASAGNSGPTAQSITVPGNVPYVITVGAMTDNYTPTNKADDRLDSFSSTGPTYEGFVKPEVVAPGGHVIAVMPGSSPIAKAHPEFLGTNGYLGSSYFYMSGTSMSAAVVSGTVALMLQAHPALTPDQVKCQLMSSSQPAVDRSGQLAYTVFQQGAGQINAFNAVFNQNYNCANQGLNIASDIAGAQHYMGPARQNAAGSFYVVDANGNPVNQQGYLWNNGYLWSSGYLWSNGYLWSSGYLWSNGYLWNSGYLWNNGYLWNQSFVPSTASPSSINAWVSQE
jgi:serine protease AprX